MHGYAGQRDRSHSSVRQPFLGPLPLLAPAQKVNQRTHLLYFHTQTSSAGLALTGNTSKSVACVTD